MNNKLKKSFYKNDAHTVANEKKLFWVFEQMKFALLFCFSCDSARLVSSFGFLHNYFHFLIVPNRIFLNGIK